MNDSKKSEGKLFKVWLNPLQLIDVDEPWSRVSEKELKPEDLIKFLCTPGIECDEKGLIQRYQEISQEKKRLFAAPAEERILEKLVWPLRHAKASYMVGNYLGTISLSGMVSEMVAMLFFEMSDLSLNNRPMNNNDEIDKTPFNISLELDVENAGTFPRLSAPRYTVRLHLLEFSRGCSKKPKCS